MCFEAPSPRKRKLFRHLLYSRRNPVSALKPFMLLLSQTQSGCSSKMGLTSVRGRVAAAGGRLVYLLALGGCASAPQCRSHLAPSKLRERTLRRKVLAGCPGAALLLETRARRRSRRIRLWSLASVASRGVFGSVEHDSAPRHLPLCLPDSIIAPQHLSAVTRHGCSRPTGMLVWGIAYGRWRG